MSTPALPHRKIGTQHHLDACPILFTTPEVKRGHPGWPFTAWGPAYADYTETYEQKYRVADSSFDLCEKVVPAVAVMTNLDQDHLDRYPNMDAYIASKK